MPSSSDSPKKTKYRVTVQRIEYRSHDFVVEAESALSASTEAMLAANDYDFSGPCGSAEETVVAVEPIQEA